MKLGVAGAVAGALGILGLLLVPAAVARAECTALARFPEFSIVARAATRIVAGTVTEGLQHSGGAGFVVFRIHVDEVLRGSAPSTLQVDGIRSPLERVPGSTDCKPENLFTVKVGWQIAIAFDGGYPGVGGQVTTAATINHAPSPYDPGMEQLTIAQIREIARLPDTSTQLGLAPDLPLDDRALILLAALLGILPLTLAARRWLRLRQ
jgi:hypothetical protein